MPKSFDNLKQIREELLGYQKLEAVARLAGISIERMRAIEDQGAAPSVYEIEELARVYGIDSDILADEPIKLTPGDGVQVLTSRKEFRDIGDAVRARIVAAANAARDLSWLRKRLADPDPRSEFKAKRPSLPGPTRGEPAFKQGVKLASALREKMNLGSDAIPSVRDLVTQKFSGLSLLYTHMSVGGPAGLSFVDPIRGPAIVLNLDGKNQNASVRRFSLAHELCHVLTDWTGGESLAAISGYFTDSKLETEQRANAFAVRFICPPVRFARLAKRLPDPAAVREIATFGLPYSAIRLYFKNETGSALPAGLASESVTLASDSRWIEPETPLGLDGFPITEVPPERRTAVAHAAARAYSQGLIARDRFAELMGITPAAPVEQILDFFALDLPADRSAVA